ncbi:MAG: hypothetical protein AAGF11_51425 [Myxococcota bacterium]
MFTFIHRLWRNTQLIREACNTASFAMVVLVGALLCRVVWADQAYYGSGDPEEGGDSAEPQEEGAELSVDVASPGEEGGSDDGTIQGDTSGREVLADDEDAAGGVPSDGLDAYDIDPETSAENGTIAGIVDDVQRAGDEDAEEGVVKSALFVDVDPGIADGELYPSWIEQRNPKLKERLPESLGARPWIAVKIAGATYDYQVAITPMQDETSIASGAIRFSCECSGEALLDSIDEGIAKAIDGLSRKAEVEPNDPEPGEATGTSDYEPQPPETSGSSDRRPALGPLGYTGLALGLLGGGALASGVVLYPREPYDIMEEGGEFELRTTESVGLALVAGGSVALVGGIIMLAVDGAKHRPRRVAIIPALDARLTGVAVRGRF